MIRITDKHNCCGCEACVQACPKQCISFEEDNEGFRYPKVDDSLCVECGACERTCPILNSDAERKPQRQVAAINPDSIVREQSSSGGIFTMLAEQVIRQKEGVVFGVRFDEHWQAVFDYTETVDGLAAFRGSKYVQALVGQSFLQAREFLKQGRMVLFSGSPCQIAGLRHFLRRDYDNLVTVDFICHGTPSPKVWSRYLDEVTQNAVHAISDVQFRNKKQGWKRFNLEMAYDKDGQTVSLSSWHQKNHFMRIFLQNVILRPSCYSCKAKGGRSGSDITIADFWGIQQLNPEMDDDMGTSLVMLHTEKGTTLYDSLNITRQWDTAYEDILKLNPSVERSAKEHDKRSQFFARLDDAQSLIKLIDDTLRIPLSARLIRLPKRILSKGYHIFKSLVGGGKPEHPLTAVQSGWPDPVTVPQLSGQYGIALVNFRSKHEGWKQYRLVIMMQKSD